MLLLLLMMMMPRGDTPGNIRRSEAPTNRQNCRNWHRRGVPNSVGPRDKDVIKVGAVVIKNPNPARV